MGGKEEKNKKVLFNDDEGDDVDISEIKINKEFAQRFLHNKKREDLHRLEELKKKGAISSSDSESKEAHSSSADDSSDSDSDDYLNLVEFSSTKQNQQFFDALLKVKKQDPVLKEDKNIKLFQDEDEQQERTEESKKKNKKESKSLYLKDVLAKQLIEEGPEFNDEDISTANEKPYVEEQEDLRKDFLNAAAAAEEAQNDKDNEFFSLKDKKTIEPYDEDSDNREFNDKLDEYFGKDDQMDDKSRFLKEFFSNKLWLDEKVANDVNLLEEEDLSEDEREVERQEEYEYRFQDNAGDRVLGHSRKIEGSVRNKKNARKDQRERKHERDDMEEKARKEELKHLKNLKKQEMHEKLNKIIKTAGIGQNDLIPLTAAEIEDEFDPEEYDKMMKKAFDDKYYDAEDADSEFCSDNDDGDELKKPDFENEDELLGLSDGWDDYESGGGFSSVRERILGKKDDKHADNEDNLPQEEGKRKRKRKVALLEKAKEAMMDEYYKLDYEDTIGDLKTRFKYAKIKPNRYGMTPADILLLDDSELNQYVSLKKIAPYREKEWKLNNQKRFELKTTVKNRLRDWKSVSNDKVVAKLRHKKSKSTPSTASAIENKSQSDEANGEIVNTSRKGSRKKHAVPTQLPLARLRAYGKIPSKPKLNKKQRQ